MTAATTRRERHRLATSGEIKQVARRQMAAEGAAALSLRAIARVMGITAPAIYRYFPSRDDLVTVLIVDAYNDLAAALDGADAQALSPAERLVRIAHAYRDWARAHPADYSLIFGTPIPGYHAPADVTRPAAIRASAAVVGLLMDVHGGGVPASGFASTPSYINRLSISAWSLLHGFVSLELNGQFDALGEDPADLYADEVAALAVRIFPLLPTTRPSPRSPPDDARG